MNNMIIELARYRMEKAKNDLKASKIMLRTICFLNLLIDPITLYFIL